MALFQPSVLKDQLRLQDEHQLNTAYKKFTGFFHNPEIQENIRSSKEEQFQATFLNELFVKVLGYTMNPQPEYNLTTEFKNQKNARKADGAILKDGQAVGVIELKGTNTKHLEGIRQQAFDYKANHKGCVYVITSNFEKLRFYINDATEFVEFDLFELNREDFSLLWFCLHRENLLSGKPLKSKEASLVEEEVITKQFYKDYSVFKRELYRDLVKRNVKKLKSLRKNDAEAEDPDTQDAEAQAEITGLEKNVKQNLFKKSQKLIDRFLFIFFAEDRALLPPNSIHKILSDWNKLKDLDAEMPLYDRFKLYFGYLDTGRKGTEKKTEIFAYNGGLFKPDPVLDMLEIDDELLYKHTSRLATYDFESQVDVNILGHIFENSLNEIESVNAEIEGADFDKQKSKRKKDGVFYTPKYITKYIVENTVGRLCEEKKSNLGFREEEYFRGRKRRQKDTLEGLVKILEDYREWLLQLTICDPACGSGAFLNQALDFLIKEHKYIDEMKAKLLGGGLILSDIENTILERNIYGVDINEESVEIAKLSLWLRTAQPRRKLNDLSNSIKCGNSLIDDKKVAGNKAFKWEAEFPEVFAKGGFDVVIGNPPYAGRNSSINDIEKDFIRKTYISSEGKFELYQLFIEKFLKLCRDNSSYIALITPQTWLSIIQAKKLRKIVIQNKELKEVVFLGKQVFEDASVDSVIFILSKGKSHNSIQLLESIDIINMNGKPSFLEYTSIDVKNNIIPFSFSSINDKIVKGISSRSLPMEKLGLWSDGVKVVGKAKNFAFQKSKVDETFFPMITGKDISRYSVHWSGQYCCRDQAKIASKNATDIRLRSEKVFKREKILIRKTGNNIVAALDLEHRYYEQSLFSFGSCLSIRQLTYLLGILNSKLANFLLRENAFSKKDTFPQIRLHWLKDFPIPKKDVSVTLSKQVEDLISKRSGMDEVVQKFLKFIQNNFPAVELGKKLQSWHELEFGDFIKELNKAIKASNKVRAKEAAVLAGEGGDAPTVIEVPTLTKKDEFEWMELFEENKKKALELQREIEKTDREIDQMVYGLYGLTEGEIAIVEGS